MKKREPISTINGIALECPAKEFVAAVQTLVAKYEAQGWEQIQINFDQYQGNLELTGLKGGLTLEEKRQKHLANIAKMKQLAALRQELKELEQDA